MSSRVSTTVIGRPTRWEAIPVKRTADTDFLNAGTPSERVKWNDNEVFYAADRPSGLIEESVLRDDALDAGHACPRPGRTPGC